MQYYCYKFGECNVTSYFIYFSYEGGIARLPGLFRCRLEEDRPLPSPVRVNPVVRGRCCSNRLRNAWISRGLG